MHVQNILDTSEPRPKQNRRPERQKHTKDSTFGYLSVFLLNFVEHYETFENFLSEPRPKQNRRPERQKHTKDSTFGYLSVFN